MVLPVMLCPGPKWNSWIVVFVGCAFGVILCQERYMRSPHSVRESEERVRDGEGILQGRVCIGTAAGDTVFTLFEPCFDSHFS